MLHKYVFLQRKAPRTQLCAFPCFAPEESSLMHARIHARTHARTCSYTVSPIYRTSRCTVRCTSTCSKAKHYRVRLFVCIVCVVQSYSLRIIICVCVRACLCVSVCSYACACMCACVCACVLVCGFNIWNNVPFGCTIAFQYVSFEYFMSYNCIMSGGKVSNRRI